MSFGFRGAHSVVSHVFASGVVSLFTQVQSTPSPRLLAQAAETPRPSLPVRSSCSTSSTSISEAATTPAQVQSVQVSFIVHTHEGKQCLIFVSRNCASHSSQCQTTKIQDAVILNHPLPHLPTTPISSCLPRPKLNG